MTRWFVLTILGLILLAGTDPDPKALQKTLLLIDSTGLMEKVNLLSGPEFQGRLPGHDGYSKAAQYAASEFEKLKLTPLPDGKYFQTFTTELNVIEDPLVLKFTDGKGKQISCVAGTDFACRGFTGKGKVKAGIVFCGYGISVPELGYDDYAGVDVKGKVVVIFKQNPSWKISGNEWPGSSVRYKAGIAKEHGAAAVLFVPLPSARDILTPIGSMLDGDEPHLPNTPQMQISGNIANLMIEGNNFDLKSWVERSDSTQVPRPLVTSCTAEIEVNTTYTADATTMNVVGILEGTDPVLKNEYIIIGAHLDHVGFQGSGLYYPGANDNASGSAAVLEIAEAWSKGKIKPARSVLFVLFSSEEHGLDGARYLSQHLPCPDSMVTAMLNLDCIAYGDSIQVGGGLSVPNLYKITRDLDKKHFGMKSVRTWHGGGADAQPFFEKGIPTLYFASLNSYDNLHLPGDKLSTLNTRLFTQIAQLAFLTSVQLATGNYQREKIK